LFVDDALSDDIPNDPFSSPIALPAPALGNLPDIQAQINGLQNTQQGRDALGKYILNEDYILKLIPLVEVAEDLEDLKLGLDEGLSQLSECKVEAASGEPLGNLIKFERIFTFQEDGMIRKRRLWLLYVDKWQMVLTWQGATEEEYDYWLSMGNYFFFTFEIPQALWFATDRDLSGHTRT